ncbi:MAG: hypothetical protein IPN88_17160 [Bacteroidetes bacterium]|nr:hypothetical protein [Bacteroidota bacterium]
MKNILYVLAILVSIGCSSPKPKTDDQADKIGILMYLNHKNGMRRSTTLPANVITSSINLMQI